jgi:hypothetical protein
MGLFRKPRSINRKDRKEFKINTLTLRALRLTHPKKFRAE